MEADATFQQLPRRAPTLIDTTSHRLTLLVHRDVPRRKQRYDSRDGVLLLCQSSGEYECQTKATLQPPTGRVRQDLG